VGAGFEVDDAGWVSQSGAADKHQGVSFMEDPVCRLQGIKVGHTWA
jgi:hypothetical protein